jgi:NhaA family Na+:H+ antiporter
VAFGVLPVFALANTAIVMGAGVVLGLATSNSLGIMSGLFIGKPLGISLVCFAAVSLGLCRLPSDLAWRHIIGAGFLGGIGFTMSIFITNLAFPGERAVIESSKFAVLLASIAAGTVGFVWLRAIGKPTRAGGTPET